MSLHPNFPKSPYEILDPSIRWFPADESLREQTYEKLLPPLVAELRKRVKEWRDDTYNGASKTSKALLRWWFQTEHLIEKSKGEFFDFKYYFAQREAIETIIYLYDVIKVKDKYDLMRFDSTGVVTANRFDETWLRFVIKMATGSGKTKVLSLVLAWCYFHKMYELSSNLARNFLIITPNIIVLDRIRADFDGLKIFSEDPIIPDNGFEGFDWKDDFQMVLHIQDDISNIKKTGNIFLTNIHRVYENGDKNSSFNDENTSDYFLGEKPVGKTNESKVDLGDIVRNIDELVVLNDEAHHIHDPKMAWFKSIEDIHHKLQMKNKFLSLQIDFTATPKHNNGAIFIQTITDYPLVEAIYQNIVKHPVLPDHVSREKLVEQTTSNYVERYREYIHLGYTEWKKVYEDMQKVNKKAVLFIMTDDTKNCDEVKVFLEKNYPDLQNSILVIHTKDNGEISESITSKSADELTKLRQEANTIDHSDNPYKVVVSVLMLKEGWDVKNVTTIVGLRAYNSPCNILPEQTLGRGLRRMFAGQNDMAEKVSVIGTNAFMEFVESIKNEGVDLEYREMNENSKPQMPILIEIDNDNVKKDIEKLDIEIPILSPRINREYKNLSLINISESSFDKIKIIAFTKEEIKKIIFRDIVTNEITHEVDFDSDIIPDYRNVVSYFVKNIMRDLRLISGYDILYGKVKDFIQNDLFEKIVDLEDKNILRNLSELSAIKTIISTFVKEINRLTVVDKGSAEIQDHIKISKTRPYVTKDQGFIIPKKSIFNKVVGDSHFELEFSSFLEECDDIIAYVKNSFAIHFKLDYCNTDGNIADYYPDFIIKTTSKECYIIELKGRESLDDVKKIERLRQWCEDINKLQNDVKYRSMYIKDDEWLKYKGKLNNFNDLVKIWGE